MSRNSQGTDVPRSPFPYVCFLEIAEMVRAEAVNFLNLRTFLHNILWS